MNINNMTKEDIMEVLAQKIAVDEFNHGLEQFEEERECYEHLEGKTEAEYMDGECIQNLQWYIAEAMVESIQEGADKAFDNLFKAKYGRSTSI